jgi:hypothetical protein
MATLAFQIGRYVKDRIWLPITKNKMAFSAFLVSVFALLLTFLTFYYQFLRRSHDFKGLVVDYRQDKGGGRSVRVVLMNNGTYYETLCDASLIYSRSKDFSDLKFVSGHNVDGPVVLRPGERMVCLVEDTSTLDEVLYSVVGSIKPLGGNMNTVLTKLDKEGKLPFRLYYGVLFEVAGNSDKVHKASCFVASIEVTKKYPILFYSNNVNRKCDLLKETFNQGGTIRRGLFREN